MGRDVFHFKTATRGVDWPSRKKPPTFEVFTVKRELLCLVLRIAYGQPNTPHHRLPRLEQPTGQSVPGTPAPGDGPHGDEGRSCSSLRADYARPFEGIGRERPPDTGAEALCGPPGRHYAGASPRRLRPDQIASVTGLTEAQGIGILGSEAFLKRQAAQQVARRLPLDLLNFNELLDAALAAMPKLLDDPKTSALTKLRIIEEIFDRDPTGALAKRTQPAQLANQPSPVFDNEAIRKLKERAVKLACFEGQTDPPQ